MKSLVTAGVLFTALALLHTWPLASAPASRSLNYNADAQLNAWIVSWTAHILPSHPTRLFDANIFAPERATLAYSEPLVAPAIVGAPILWLGGSPVLAFNVLLIAGLALTGWSTWFVAARWTDSFAAGVFAGTLATFNVHLLTRLPHLQAAHAWGLPFAWFFADRLIDRPTWRDGAALAVVIALTATTSLYWLALVSVILVVVAVTAPRLRGWIAIGAAGLAGLILAAPVLYPYARFAAAGASRPLEMVAAFSATPAGYLASSSRLYATITAPFHTVDTNLFFPGVIAIVLGAIGLIRTWRPALAGPDRRLIACGVLVAVGFLLSLGPSTVFYEWLYRWVMPLRGLRAAARFGYLLLLALAVASAYGWMWIERRIASPRARFAWTAGLVAAITVEAWQGPVRTEAFTGVPRIYTLLARPTSPVRLVEVPFYWPNEVFRNGEYVFNSTAHWQPIENGYSGYTPMSYRTRAETLSLFPAPVAFETLRRDGATHLMVHLEHFGASRRDLERDLEGRPDLQLMAADRDGHRLYRINFP